MKRQLVGSEAGGCAAMVHLFVVGTMLGPGAPGFPWQWDAFGGGPGKNGGSSDSTLYPVSDGTPHPKMKVR